MNAAYAESLKDVLIRKIVRAERDLHQLKMDYCRFVYGIGHRSQVSYQGKNYLVKAVDLDSMERLNNGEWSQPTLSGVMLSELGKPLTDEVLNIPQGWVGA